jgi:hypothetical protein
LLKGTPHVTSVAGRVVEWEGPREPRQHPRHHRSPTRSSGDDTTEKVAAAIDADNCRERASIEEEPDHAEQEERERDHR